MLTETEAKIADQLQAALAENAYLVEVLKDAMRETSHKLIFDIVGKGDYDSGEQTKWMDKARIIIANDAIFNRS